MSRSLELLLGMGLPLVRQHQFVLRAKACHDARLPGIMCSRQGVPWCSVDASDSGRADAGRR